MSEEIGLVLTTQPRDDRRLHAAREALGKRKVAVLGRESCRATELFQRYGTVNHP